jgi:hypothetical protein
MQAALLHNDFRVPACVRVPCLRAGADGCWVVTVYCMLVPCLLYNNDFPVLLNSPVHTKAFIHWALDVVLC